MKETDRKSTVKDWLTVLAALSDDIAILALIYLALWFFHVRIPLTVLIPVGLVVIIIFYFLHRAILLSLRQKKVTGVESMVGMVGKVVKPLKQGGIIKVGGEYWKAKSGNEHINSGEDVEIIEVDGLTLKVKRKI
jgi:membrane-bound ClpP family serine protease